MARHCLLHTQHRNIKSKIFKKKIPMLLALNMMYITLIPVTRIIYLQNNIQLSVECTSSLSRSL